MEFMSIDLETTNRSINGEIVQIGVVLFDLTLENGVWRSSEVSRYSSYVRYLHPETLDKEAMAVNKIPHEILRNAPLPHIVKEEFLELWEEELEARKFIPLGQNFGGFDKRFLEEFFGQYYELMFDYHSYDTWTLAKTCQMLGHLPEKQGLSLAPLAEFFGIERLDHLAIPDTLNAIDVTVNLLNLLQSKIGD